MLRASTRMLPEYQQQLKAIDNSLKSELEQLSAAPTLSSQL